MAAKKTILVTGANGFLGSHLVERLIEQGHHVRGLVRATSDLRWLSHHQAHHTIELVHGTFDDEAALRRATKGADLVVHLAAAKAARHRQTFMDVNAGGTERLAKAAAHHGRLERFVYVSSGAASGPCLRGHEPVTEDQPPHPVSDYGATKLEGERRLQGLGLPFAILRPPIVYGPRDEDMLIFFRTVAKGLRPILMGGARYLTMLHVDDVVNAVLAGMFHPQTLNQTFLVGDGPGITWEEAGALTADLLRKKAVKLKLPVWALFTAAAMSEWTASLVGKSATLNLDKAREATHHWVFSGEKLKKATGWQPAYSTESGFRHTFEWYRAEGWL